jgi:hypothetical protein
MLKNLCSQNLSARLPSILGTVPHGWVLATPQSLVSSFICGVMQVVMVDR